MPSLTLVMCVSGLGHLSIHVLHLVSKPQLSVFLLQGRAESLRKERDMLKLVESRLTQEKETMQTQQRVQNMLLTNLKTIEVHTDTHTNLKTIDTSHTNRP